MNDRERMIAWLLGKPVDRPPFWLFWGPWESTMKRWETEGKPPALTDLRTHFGSDLTPGAVLVNCGPCPLMDTSIIHEDDVTYTFRDSWGILRRDFKHGVSMPQFLDFPVKDWDDWYRFRDTWLDPHHPRRLDGNWREQCAAWVDAGRPIQLGNYPDVGIFGTFRWLMGDEEGLVAFHTLPDLVHAIMDHMTTLYLAVFEQVVHEVRVDRIHLWEDMCYRSGPLISPRHWREFLGPHYRRIKDFANAHNIPILSVDTDGDPWKIAEPMIETGVNLLLPMEVAAGCDVNRWQADFPALAMMGGIDKRVLAQDYAAIDRELERIRPALERGCYIPELDHLVPDDVPWQNYCYYAERLKEMVYTCTIK